jgi:anti-anti-sigma regulatory factor
MGRLADPTEQTSTARPRENGRDAPFPAPPAALLDHDVRALGGEVAALREQVAAGHLVVDLSGVRFLNYHAVVALVWAHHAASRAGVAFHLVGADTPAVNRPLRIAGVLRHLDPHRRRSVAEVLADLGSGPHPVASPVEPGR